MSNYTKTTDFEAKDSLPTGDSGKIIRGAEFETEFDAISTAIATKADTAGPTFTGTLTFETISDGTIGVTAFVDEDNMASNSATLVPTQQSVKAYVDSQVTAQDLDFQADSGGALSIDLDSETLTFTGGTGVDTSGSGNAVTFAIDSTVATLTGTQTLTNKTLTSPDVNTPDIDGGTIDGTVIGGATPAAVSATTVSATGNITVGGTVDGRDIATDGTKLDGIESGATADQTAAEIRTLVESATDSNVFTDADHTKLNGIEAGATGDQTNAEIRAAVEAATDSNVFTDADHSKLDGIEASADVTDTANVTAAGALMDSELTSIASVKALNQGVATTDSPTFAAVTVNGNVEFDGLSGTGSVTVTDILDQDDMSGNSATALATQQSIKAYVDSQVATADTLSEVLANGNTTGGTDVAFGDNDKAIFGAGSDLQIYHDGTNSYISDQGTNDLKVLATDFQLKNAADNEFMMTAVTDGAVTAYHNGSAKLATTSTGIDVTGVITTDGMTTSADINFGDDDKALFGAGNDLKIYHSANNQSYIHEAGTGDLNILASNFKIQNGAGTENKIVANTDGAVSLYYDNSAKLATTSTGIDVTGKVVSDGLDTSEDLIIRHSTTDHLQSILGTDGGGFAIEDNNYFAIWHQDIANVGTDTGLTQRFQIASNGDVSLYEDSGTTAKLFWDASAESLGIGTSSPNALLEVSNITANDIPLFISGGTPSLGSLPETTGIGFGYGSAAGYKKGAIIWEFTATNGTGKFHICNDGAADAGNAQLSDSKLTIDSSGNVGIGTNSPAATLHTVANSGTTALLTVGASGNNIASFYTSGSSQVMTLDVSGNLLVGKTSASFTTAGLELRNGGPAIFGRDQAEPLIVNRLTTDGGIVNFNKDGTTVGSIQSRAGAVTTIVLDPRSNGAGISGSSNAILPTNEAGNPQNNLVSVGTSTNNFKDLYLSGFTRYNSEVYVGDGASISGSYSANDLLLHTDNNPIVIRPNGSEAARFDSSGNLLVGTTTLAPQNFSSGSGTQISDGYIAAARGGAVALLNRVSTDGDIVELKKDGTTVGSIGVQTGNRLAIFGTNGSSSGAGLYYGDSVLLPVNHAGTLTDNAIDLGQSNYRFKDLYLSGNINLSASSQINSSTAFYLDSDIIHFRRNNESESARIDSSGNLLVGKTAVSGSTAGIQLKPAGELSVVRDGNHALILNRLSSDGSLALFQKGSSTIGSIGVDSGDNLYIAGSAANHGGLYFGTNTAAPLSAGTLTDDAMDLGTATYRFDDVYATNGTINTSDRNEKQDIEALSDAEQRVAVACKGLLRKFRWKSSVTEKGDDARIHFGIIAQDLQAAFEAEGLDAGRYAMFISTTWTDEETGEERTRMGVRYSELLAFIIAAI